MEKDSKMRVEDIFKDEEKEPRNYRIIWPVIICIYICVSYYFFLPPLNIAATEFWLYVISVEIIVMVEMYFISIIGAFVNSRGYDFGEFVSVNGVDSIISNKLARIAEIAVIGTIAIAILVVVSCSPMFTSSKYYERIEVNFGVYEEDVESVELNQLALLDKNSTKNLGDRVMGQLTDLVSQFSVSNEYAQITYQNDIVRVTPLEYNGWIKYFTNKDTGVPGYITVDSVTGETNLTRLEVGIQYTQSALFDKDLKRKLRFSYPTEIFGEITFEIDDEGNPYYVVQTVKFSGIGQCKEVKGIILLNPVNGTSQKYNLEDVPEWVDHVQSSSLTIEQLNSWGAYKNGFWNSIFGQKEVVMTTEGYNYIAKDGDIYLYTGITSVASDESNIGFVMSNLRTKETTLYNIAGAEEYSAMASAEGQVQQMSYSATFPLLVNLDSKPTYIISLKDSAGLVKMYAFVDYTDYQRVVVTESSEGIQKAAEMYLGVEIYEKTSSSTIEIDEIGSAIINGNTTYFISSQSKIYSAEINVNPNVLVFLVEGDIVKITYDEGTNRIIEVSK